MRRAVVAVSCALVATACAGPAPPAQPSSAPIPTSTPASTPTAIVVQAVQPLPVGGVKVVPWPSPVALPLALIGGRSGSDLRVSLDLLLQENGFLQASAMDAVTNGRLDQLIASSSALDNNSLALAELVGAVKGQSAAKTMIDAWRDEVRDLVNYAQGQHASAAADIDRLQPTIAGQLAIGDLSESATEALLRKRTQSELALADSLVAHDAVQSAQQLRSLAENSDAVGAPLAAAMAAQLKELSPQTTEGGDVDVRLQLTTGLQEHLYLTGAAMQAGADTRSADLQAYSDAASQVATRLGDELSSAYSADVGTVVADRLRTETAAFVSAASGGDRQQAATDIEHARRDIDAALSGVNQLLAPGLVNQQLRSSDQPLLTGADAFLARDDQTAFARLREAARLIQRAADTLAQTIVDRYPGRYLNLPPVGGSPHRSAVRGGSRR